MYPVLNIDLNRIEQNMRTILWECRKRGIKPMGITKAYCADVYIAQKLLDAGFCKIGDSRLKNLKNFQDWRVEKILIRIPMSCEVKELVTYADTALISSVDTARLIDAEAQKQQKLFKLILMMELGDLREGIYGYEALLKAAKTLEQMPAVHLQGIGTNIGCVSGVTPSAENMARLAQIKKRLESDIGRKLEVLSAGSSDVFGFMMREGLPDRINELRIGEATIMGTNGAEEHIAGLAEHCITLDAQVVEVFEKPSVPLGDRSINPFGEAVEVEDIGIRRRAIVALGRQDVHLTFLKPLKKGAYILAQSSDHTVLDVEECGDVYVGDVLTFQLKYGGILSAFTSGYVDRSYLSRAE